MQLSDFRYSNNIQNKYFIPCQIIILIFYRSDQHVIYHAMKTFYICNTNWQLHHNKEFN